MTRIPNAIAWSLTLLLAVQSAYALNIDVTYSAAAGQAWNAERIGVVEQAAADWESWIRDPRTIVVDLTFESAGQGSFLAQWSAGGSFTTGTDIYPWTHGLDHTVKLNTYYLDEGLGHRLWWDPTPDTGGDQPFAHWDVLSVVRHEFGHMLGFSPGLYLDDFNTDHETSRWQDQIDGTTFDPGGLDVTMAGLNNLGHIADAGDTAGDLMVTSLVNGIRRDISYLDHQMLSLAHGYASIPVGDANRDGAVTDADYTCWADCYGTSGGTWPMGDFNCDGEVTDADYTLWADHYGQTGRAVPEPLSAALLLGPALILLRRGS